MNNIEISIIMVTYNREQYLKTAIESVLQQTKKEFEFIIINNGSTDNSLAICESYKNMDQRVKIINIDNCSIGTARNVGLSVAQGKYISFVDDDDYMVDDMFMYLYELIQEYDADISICGCYSDFGNHLETYYIYDEVYVLNKQQCVCELLNRKIYNSANPCKLFKHELFNDVRYLEESRYDDIHTIYKLFVAANKVVATGIPKYYFRKHNTNNSRFIVTNNLTVEQLKEYISAFEKRTEYITKYIPELNHRAKCAQWSYMLSMFEKIKVNNIEECYEMSNYMEEEIKKNINEFSASQYLTNRDVELLGKYFK